MPHAGREAALSFFPNPTMQTYLALPPARADVELPCRQARSVRQIRLHDGQAKEASEV